MSTRPRLTKDEFQAWRDHPVTVIVRRYLTDMAGSIRSDWAQEANWTDESKIEVHSLEDLADIDLESIESFYRMREADEQERTAPD